MVCIYCNGDTKVVNSRLQRRSNNIWRRRKCSSCGSIFTTHESIELENALVLQNATDIKTFVRDKLFISIYEACRHRQTAASDAGALTQTVLSKAFELGGSKAAISRDLLVATTFKILGNFDKAAATAYLAYHPLPKNFTS